MSKEDILKANGTYNRSHGKVTAEKFLTGGFYDPMDIIQVKYEMLREASESPHRNITELASSYGFSRASFYKIKEAYEKNGVQALVPGKSGPRQAHKLTVEYRFFIDDHPKASSEEIRLRLQKERGLTLSRRTIERYRSRKKAADAGKHCRIQSESTPVLHEASDHRKIREYYDRAACDDQAGKTYMISHGMLLWLKTVEKNCRRNSRPDRVHGLPAAQSGEFVVLIANLLEEDALMDARDFDFQRIAQGYKKRPFLHKQVIERFHRDVAFRNFCNGLDIGCGAGLSSKALKMICRHVTGTDISGEMIAAAKELYKGEEGYDFIVSRAEELPDFPVRFEVVTAAGVVQWVEKDRFLTGLGKKMVENGYLLVYDFCISDRMKDCPAYTAWWHDCYLKEFPRPFRNEAVWTKEDAARCGFRMIDQIQYEMEYEFDQEAFTTFMMIQSNVNAKIEGGSRSVRAVREWFEQSVEPLFHGERRTVIFTGYSWYMERE